MSVNIPDDILKRVLKVVGYPIVTVEDFTANNMSLDDLKEIVLVDAFNTYFGIFPFKTTTEHSVTQTFEIPFPNDDVYGIINYHITVYQNLATGRTGSVFLDAVTTNQYGTSFGGGAFGTKYNYDMTIGREWERLQRSAIIDSYRNDRVNVDTVNRKITGYSNFPGKLNVTWASNTNDWDSVPAQHQSTVLKLLQAELQIYLSQIRAQLQNDSPASFDWSTMYDAGVKAKEEAVEYLQSLPKIAVMRS